MKSSQLVEIR